ncbi:metallophosphoesterase [Streptomyces chitinivorans]|uniref:Metallophosphoesterase n=1 Tax=Streptomyces chitinivorans TaxID=1257027 RepID=A0ABW7HWF1_9ACTN|nr:metallophosphoesterase [Streptomyces chitinivorans]MDH2411395.1 metallophosphoesterase [Streptomyces chitinivorans]
MSREPLRPRRAPARRSAAVPRALRRRFRAHRPAPVYSLSHTPHPYARAFALAAVALLGAWLGLLVVGSVKADVGPVDTRMSLRPSLTGGTEISVPPLGALELDSHHAPLALDVDIDQLDPERAQALIDRPERISGLEEQITGDVRSGTRDLAVKASVAVVSGATALGLAVYRRPRRALAAGGLALALLAASGASAYATWNPKSLLEPKFSGLLASAPSVVGNARSIVTDFDVYQQELARLVTNVTKLYDATSTLPAYQPDPSTIRVLHVSDIHLNPAAWHIVRSLVEQYDIAVIIDTGDTMDHGTAAENGFLDPIEDLGAPYVWARGNHDSRTTQEYIEELDNTHVLDGGKPVTVGGLRIAGIGDPQFTPDRSVVARGDAAERVAGRKLAASLRRSAAAGKPVHIAAAHNPIAAQQTDGDVPLVLAGHVHRREARVMEEGTRLMIEGSTGGGGLRAVEGDEPQKVMASVLYLDRDTKRLQAWDEITLGGLGLTTAEVSRRLPEDVEPGSSPSPSPSGSPSPSESPSGSPSDSPSRSPSPTPSGQPSD